VSAFGAKGDSEISTMNKEQQACCNPADSTRQSVREAYASIATKGGNSGCCLPEQTSLSETASDEALSRLFGYADDELSAVPEGANMGLGCGNPSAFADIKEGEVVMDLGSGGGFDCFLAARKVGQTGRVIGIDMTPEMLGKARDNAQKSPFDNVEFRLGEIENLPVADNSVDLVISNCVINLSPDKPRVIAETFRTLKPGGRIAIADVVATKEMPDEIKNDTRLLCGCVSGAASVADISKWLEQAGFSAIDITPNEESREGIKDWAPGTGVENYVVSATIKALKPVS
jgi:arsenite methyltransferase